VIVAIGTHLDVNVDIDRCPVFEWWCQDSPPDKIRKDDIKVPDILRPSMT
jgi:hypothetical protein